MAAETKVPSSGPVPARIMVIGEAPGADEVREKTPFIGAAGNLLRGCLAKAGIDPDQVHFANLCKYRPPSNELRTFFDTNGFPNAKVHEGLAELKAEIAAVNPNIIIPVGNYPLKFLTGRGTWDDGFTGIGSYRGSILQGTAFCGGRKCLPTYHPAAALRNYSWKHIIQADLVRANREQLFPEIRRPRKFILVDPTGDEKYKWAGWLVSKPGTLSPRFRFADTPSEFTQLPSGGFLTGDIEYIGSKLLCLGLTRHADVAIVFATRTAADIGFIRDLLLSGIPLCFQNAMFDCSILEYFYDIPALKYLKHDTMIAMHAAYTEFPKDLGFIGSLFTEQPVEGWFEMPLGDGKYEMLGGKFWKKVAKALGTQSLADYEKVYLPYNGIDVWVTHSAMEQMLSDELTDQDVRQTYEHEMALVKPLWEIGKRGVAINTVALAQLSSTLQQEAELLTAGIAAYNGGSPVNVKSPPQVAAFIYDQMGCPTLGAAKTPTGRFQMNDDELARLILKVKDERQRTAIKMVREARERIDLISKFCEIELDDDGRMRCHYDPAKTDTGRLASRKFYPTGRGCVPGDAEVLTPNGWVRLDALGDRAIVMQWKPNSELSWSPAQRVEYDYTGPMVKADCWFHKGLYTPEHRVPYHDKNICFQGERAIIQVYDQHYWSLPVSGFFDGVFAQNPWIRLSVMAQADGSIEHGGIRLCFSKQRKIDRFMKLCEEAKIPWTEQSATQGRRFYISSQHAAPILRLITANGEYKTFGESLLLLTRDALEAFIDEVRYWDSHQRGDSFQYFTVNKTNAEWVATVAHLTGNSASISINKDNNRGYGQGNNQWLYTVNIKPRKHIRCERKHFSLEDYTGKVYCVTTESTYFLLRYKGQIVVTGNTNLQNVPKDTRVRAVFVPDRGRLFCYADLKSAESLVVAHITGDTEMLRLHSPEYIDGLRDGHKYVASFLLDKPIERITKDERYLGKRCRHAGNYGLGWYRLMQLINGDAQKTGVSVDAAMSKVLINKYRQLHPGLQVWWNNILAELWSTHTIFTQHRRKRVFYGRPDEILPEAIAYNPQGTVAQTLNMGLLRLTRAYSYVDDPVHNWQVMWDYERYAAQEVAAMQSMSSMVNNLGFEMILQVHDAIGFQVPEENAATVLPLVRDLMAIPIEIKRRGVEPYTITIPVDIQTGYNWGEWDEKKNPSGLKVWHG